MTMNIRQNIDNNIVADIAARIERLIIDARANVARSIKLAATTKTGHIQR